MRSVWLIAVSLMLVAGSAHAQSAGTYEEAVSARRSGDAGRAVRILAPIVSANPDHADAQVQYGYALIALGRLDEAGHAFREALRVAPHYEDATLGLAMVAERSRDAAEARRLLDNVSAANPDAAALRKRLAPPAGAYRLDVDGSFSALGAGQPDWKEASIQLRAPVGDKSWLTGRIEASRRFAKSDVYGEARFDIRTASGLTAYVLGGGTPRADFRPKVQLGGGIEQSLSASSNPTILTGDLRWARYASGAIWSVEPGIQQYLADGRLWLTGRWINVVADGQRSSGWLARADLQALPRLRLFGGLSDAPDMFEGIVIETSSLFGGLSVDLDDRHSLRMSLARENREFGADRTTVSLGTGVRF